MEDNTTSNAAPAQTVANRDEIKMLAVLAWIFAPISSFVLKDNSNEFVRWHARASLYFGIAALVAYVIGWVGMEILWRVFFMLLGTALAFSWLWGIVALLVQLAWLVVWCAVVIPRLYAAWKAYNLEKWEIPAISNFVRKYVKV